MAGHHGAACCPDGRGGGRSPTAQPEPQCRNCQRCRKNRAPEIKYLVPPELPCVQHISLGDFSLGKVVCRSHRCSMGNKNRTLDQSEQPVAALYEPQSAASQQTAGIFSHSRRSLRRQQALCPGAGRRQNLFPTRGFPWYRANLCTGTFECSEAPGLPAAEAVSSLTSDHPVAAGTICACQKLANGHQVWSCQRLFPGCPARALKNGCGVSDEATGLGQHYGLQIQEFPGQRLPGQGDQF